MTRARQLALVLMTLTLVAAATWSVDSHFTEDFSTTLFKDAANTTALWDTTTGQARLYPFSPAVIGIEATAGQALNVAVEGQYAYVADNNGLKVVDIGDRNNPKLVASVSTPGTTRHVAIAGNYAYVADSDSGLAVVDITDPLAPAVVGRADTPGTAMAVVISGNRAYIADNNSDLQIADITDPTNPSLIGSLSFAGQALDIDVSGDRVYIAAGGGGMHIIDVLDPTAPFWIITQPTPGLARGIDVSGDLAYVAGSGAGLHIIDVSGAGSVALRSTTELSGMAYDVAVLGSVAYVALAGDGMDIVDVSALWGPSELANIVTANSALGVAVDGNYAFVAVNSAGLQVVEVAAPSDIHQLSGSFLLWSPTMHVLDGDYLVTSQPTAGVYIWDVSTPVSPTQLANINRVANSFTVDGNHLYLSSGFDLYIYDLVYPNSPAQVGSVPSAGYHDVLVADGDYLYGGSGSSLDVLDVHDPTAPFAVATVAAPAAGGIVISGNTLYAIGSGCASPCFMSVVDISDPTQPAVVGTFTPPAGMTQTASLAVSGDHAYVGVRGTPDSLFVIDVTDPSLPTQVRSLAIDANKLTAHGNLLYVSELHNGVSTVRGKVHTLDISKPGAPVLIHTSELDAGTGVTNISIHGDVAFADGRSNAIHVLHMASRYFLDDNAVQSLPRIPAGMAALQIKIATVETGVGEWSIQDTTGYWWDIAPNLPPPNEWAYLTVASDLAWRVQLVEDPISSPGISPAVSSVNLDYRFAQAIIDSIVDVPGDQGSWARVHCTRSAYDDVNAPLNAEDYVLWRRTTPSAAATSVTNPGLHPDAAAMALSLPPGTWEIITSFSPMFEEHYLLLAPTLADSSSGGVAHTAYVLTTKVGTGASTAFYVSPIDSGYSVDNIAPGVPQAFAVAYNAGGGNQLSWDAATEPDFQYYRVYRSADPGFTPGPGTLVHETAAAGWTDPIAGGYQYTYKVTTLDHAGNESAPTGAATVTGTPASKPAVWALETNFPNPFNPATTIAYSLAQSSAVTLRIYDAAGRRIRTLVDGHRSAKEHRVVWDGRDESGSPVASGVYFYSLKSTGFEQTRKMILLK